MGARLLVIGRQGQVARSFRDLGRPETVCLGRPDLDLEDIPSIARAIAAERPDVVVNPAAYTAVDKAESEPERAFALNETGARNVARAAAEAGLPIVHVSTDYVFDGTKGAPYEPGDAANPINVYGASKLAGEAAVAAANPRHVIVRTAWLYSPYGSNFVRTMLRLGREREEVRVVDDQLGCPTAAQDVAAALAALGERSAASGSAAAWGVYHLAGAEEGTWFDFAQAIFAAPGAPAPRLSPIASADYPGAARRAPDTRLATSRHGLMRGLTAAGFRARVSEVVGRLLAEPPSPA
jgi:dTDP-4-dehydrorhamnose reductase